MNGNNGQQPQPQQYAQQPQQQQPQPQQLQQVAPPQRQLHDPDMHVPGQTTSKQGVTVFLFGGIGTWKTTFAGTWPNPLFFSVGAEGGDDALTQLPTIYGIQTPRVYQITSCKQMSAKIDTVVQNYRAWGINTVVIDSITFYSDLWIRESMEAKLRQGKKGQDLQMAPREWGFLENHLVKEIAGKLHATNLNVIWIALQREKTSTDQGGNTSVERISPFIQGQAAVKLPAMCKMVIHADKQMQADLQNPGRMMSKPIYWTSPSMLCKDVRHKYGNAFSEGCLIDPQGGTYPMFHGIESRIGQFIYR
jgi:hypothetical protein